MKKYFKILWFAFKEQMEYWWNFFLSMFAMVINDFLFVFIFIVFVGYFTWTWLTVWSFLIMHSIISFQYAIVNWIFSNIWDLPNIVEEWKLDYYLSFPIDALKFISVSKIRVHNLGDVIFAILSMIVYAFWFYQGNVNIFIIKWIIISFIALVFAAGLFIMVGSVSFWLQKWSKVRDLFQSFFIIFWSYPPVIFQQKKIIFILVALTWLYPWVFLPYRMMTSQAKPIQWIILIWSAVLIFIIGVFVFRRWLKRYSSGNLVVQM